MNHKTGAVAHYNFTAQDQLFLDANIWLYIHGPQKLRGYWTRIYTPAFNRILKANSRIYIDVLVLSEFINRYARLEWELGPSPRRTFKAFRSSSDFKPVAQDIAADVKIILSYCSPIESGFATLEMDNLLTEYAGGNADFNDQVITELCKSNELTLITHDSDFRTQEIPVLTANPSLLRR